MRNRLILCVGFRGSGKSTTASSILRANNGVFVFDPHCDEAYRWIRNTALSAEELEDYSRWRREANPRRVALRYVPDGRLDPFEALNDFCAWAWTWRNIWMCVEEVSESARSVSSTGMPPELRRIVNQGRHRGINQIYCGLRYAEIPRPISAGADVQILFRCQEPLDLDAMRSRIGSEAAERVQALGKHEALVFFPDRSFQVINSRDAGLAELVLKDSANVQADVQEESA
ncbi:MAG TPA: hypothetical protein VE778_06185 [Candidatus Bathyarchaeia archaeon]|nr:hypothetical protein [Candidatus Bathyarchaeia archaeon]